MNAQSLFSRLVRDLFETCFRVTIMAGCHGVRGAGGVHASSVPSRRERSQRADRLTVWARESAAGALRSLRGRGFHVALAAVGSRRHPMAAAAAAIARHALGAATLASAASSRLA